MNVYSKFGLNILTMKDLRQFFLPPVKFQKVQIVPSGSNTSIIKEICIHKFNTKILVYYAF